MAVHLVTAWLALIALLVLKAGADQTTTPMAKGAGLVDAVIERIDASCVFPDDKLLTRRIAYVASSDGNDPNTFRSGYYGGIWQVDEDMFGKTKIVGATLDVQRNAIKVSFGIDWMTVTWQDLTKPLYSALAARLFTQNQGGPPPASIPRDVTGQANFYVLYCKPKSSADDFTTKVGQLEAQSDCQGNGADIIFILDGSGSINQTNFDLIKKFVKSAINDLDVGPGLRQTQVGVIQFSTDVYFEFNLTTYTNKADMIAAIDRMPYRGGGTNTNLALDAMRISGFSAQNGARSLANGYSRVGIVVTDGQSNTPDRTAIAAKQTHAADITMIAVGVGQAQVTELRIIASDPVCLHVIMLDSFTEFDSVNRIIARRTCDAPVIISGEEDRTATLPPGKDQNCKIKIPLTGITMRLWTTTGNATFYLSNTTYPSAYFNDQSVTSTPGEPGVVYVKYTSVSASVLTANADPDPSAQGVVYANIQGSASAATTFKLQATSGNDDHCLSSPCGGGQRCVDTGASYTCKSGADALRTSALLSLLGVVLSALLRG